MHFVMEMGERDSVRAGPGIYCFMTEAVEC